MAGAGNDFIVIDAQKGLTYKSLAKKVCDRTNGIGADGLIILDKSKKKQDYRMRIINADGSEAEMCGNGARCLAAYIVKTKAPKKKIFSIETLAGEVLGEAKGEIANIRLSDPTDHQADMVIHVSSRTWKVQYIDTGVPHAVIFVEDPEKINVQVFGKAIRNHQKFRPRGTNVNFVAFENNTLVTARTYERGVEDETKACGTGSVACALIGYLQTHPYTSNKKGAQMRVRTRGGEILQVTFDLIDDRITNVWLKGSAKFICEGTYYIK